MSDKKIYMREYVLRRYHKRRSEAVAFLGGKCVRCGTTENLEIDHVDPETKNINIAQMWSVSKARFDAEVKLCQLLCITHHREKSRGERSVGHGGGLTGMRNCRCELCGPLKNAYNRSRRRKR